MTRSDAPNASWRRALAEGDRDAFMQEAAPFTELLLRLARHDIAYYVFEGYLHRDDLTPEEVVGESLIYAWEHRRRVPEGLSLRAWLVSVLHRTLRGMAVQQRRYRRDKAISLDEPIPPGVLSFDTQEWFWEWYQPDVTLTWEDITPGTRPVDIEVPLESPEDLFALDENHQHVLMMHDEFDMPLSEVAFVLGRAVNETAELLDQARASLRERIAPPRL